MTTFVTVIAFTLIGSTIALALFMKYAPEIDHDGRIIPD
jgi:hypothetical protein